MTRLRERFLLTKHGGRVIVGYPYPSMGDMKQVEGSYTGESLFVNVDSHTVARVYIIETADGYRAIKTPALKYPEY